MEEGDGGGTANPVPDVLDTKAVVPDAENAEDNSVNLSTTLVCRASGCDKEADEFMIECNRCKHAIHFACTRLPAYQLQMFMTKGYKRYICETCYGQVDDYYTPHCYDNANPRADELQAENASLREAAADVGKSTVDKQRELDLTYADLEKQRKENAVLNEKFRSLEEENTKMETRLKAQGVMLTSYRNKSLTSPKQADAMLTTENKALVSKIGRMQSEIEAYSQSMSSYEASEVTLKNIIAERDAELVKQQNKFEEASNPEIDNLVKLEKCMKNELMLIGQSIKDSLVKEIQENNKIMEEKLNLNKPPTRGPWYTPPANNGDEEDDTEPQPGSQHPAVVDFRTIIQEQQKEQLNEVNDQRARARNIVIHGVAEDADADKTLSKQRDEDFVKNLFRSMTISDLAFKTVHRIGRPQPDKKRPIMVIMNTEVDKEKIMQNLSNLRDKTEFKGISVTEDYTLAERQMLLDWREKATAKNNEEEPNSKFIWRVRGTPKNGLMLKKFLKQKPEIRTV